VRGEQESLIVEWVSRWASGVDSPSGSDGVCCSLASLGSHDSSLLESLLEGTGHVEACFWVVITSTGEQFAEAFDAVVEVDELAWLS